MTRLEEVTKELERLAADPYIAESDADMGWKNRRMAELEGEKRGLEA